MSLAETIQAGIPPISSALSRVYASRETITDGGIALQAYNERAQLRVVTTSSGDNEPEAGGHRELEVAARATKAALARVAHAALGAISNQRRLDVRGLHELPQRYPPARLGRRNGRSGRLRAQAGGQAYPKSQSHQVAKATKWPNLQADWPLPKR